MHSAINYCNNDTILIISINDSQLNAELRSARSSRSTPGHHRLRPIVRSRERRAMAERWGALSGTGEVPEELIDQVETINGGNYCYA